MTEAQDSTVADVNNAPANEGGENTNGGTILGGDAKPEGEAQPIDYTGLKAPEGFESLDSKMLEVYTPLFQEAKLPAEVAQKLVDQYAQSLPQIVEQAEAAAFDKINGEIIARSEEWARAVKSDPELGGAKLESTISSIETLYSAVLNSEETAQLKKALNETGMGNHPVLIKLLSKNGALVAQDSFERGKAAEVPRDPATILFGSTSN